MIEHKQDDSTCINQKALEMETLPPSIPPAEDSEITYF